MTRRLHALMAFDAVVLVVALMSTQVGAPVNDDRMPVAGWTTAARVAATHFLDRYVDPDGRVVRRDQGDDTVSEGQAYAMLLAAALGDRDTFTRVWAWTSTHLRRPDGLLSWHWADGRLLDEQSATDADLDASRALVVAGARFGVAGWTADGRALGDAVLASETASVGDDLVLVAGPWARQPVVFNPGYVSPRSFAALAQVSGDARWRRLDAGDVATVEGTDTNGLPADWARVDASGRLRATRGYGLDATRAPIRFAEDCSVDGRRLAASWWRALSTRDNRHAAAVAAAAAAAWAAGDRPRADELFHTAEERDRRAPTYFGAAVVAVARVLVTTDLLGRC